MQSDDDDSRKENAIQEARTGYDALSEAQKTKVSNYELLTQAEAKLSELKKKEENSKTDRILLLQK